MSSTMYIFYFMLIHRARIQDFEMGGWIFSTSIREIREIKYYFNIWGIRKKKKEGGSEKGGGGGENSPISPPLDPRLFTTA